MSNVLSRSTSSTPARFLLRRAHQIAVGIFVQECAVYGLTPPQHSTLIVVDGARASISPRSPVRSASTGDGRPGGGGLEGRGPAHAAELACGPAAQGARPDTAGPGADTPGRSRYPADLETVACPAAREQRQHFVESCSSSPARSTKPRVLPSTRRPGQRSGAASLWVPDVRGRRRKAFSSAPRSTMSNS